MMIKNILSITAMLVAITASAQNDSLMNQGRYDYELSKSAWQGSNNAATLSLQNHINFGKAYFNYSHKGGDFYRVQEGDMNNRLQFFTESWQKLGKYLYAYGKFDFNTGRTKNRSWTDVMRPYNSNPYFSGSGIKASYEMKERIAGSALYVYLGLGHAAYEEARDFNQRVFHFLSGTAV